MNLPQFTHLNSDAQVYYMLNKGVCIAERKTRMALVFLYQVEDFYVEVYHDHSTAEVLSLRSFSSTDELDPYLQNINVPFFA